MTTVFEGTWVALVTPFRDGALDETALCDLVERQIAGGVDGLVPCGTTGESPVLTAAEQARVIRTVVEQARGRVPVLAGSGSNATALTIDQSRAAREAGADGLLLVCPYYNRPSQAGLEAHFRAVAAAVPLPIVLYNIPSRTGCDLAVDTLGRLQDVPQIVGVKEATGNIVRAQSIQAQLGDRFTVLCGDDALTLGMLAVGAKGVISVTANLFPQEVSEVVRRWGEGDWRGAWNLHRRLVPIHEAMFVETNPGPVKAVLALAGWIAPEVRGPLLWPSDAALSAVAAAIQGAGLEVAQAGASS